MPTIRKAAQRLYSLDDLRTIVAETLAAMARDAVGQKMRDRKSQYKKRGATTAETHGMVGCFYIHAGVLFEASEYIRRGGILVMPAEQAPAAKVAKGQKKR